MKTLLVFGEKTFRIKIQDDDKVTFGPFSPPVKGGYRIAGDSQGTLRVYRGSKDNILACFAGVSGFREEGLDYAEQVAKEEGATIWKSDRSGYEREEKVKRSEEWLDPAKQLTVKAKAKVKKHG